MAVYTSPTAHAGPSPEQIQAAEAALLQHHSVKACAILPAVGKTGVVHLVAFVQSEGAISSLALRSCLARSLPDDLLPSRFVPLAAIPLTPEGKPDRKALRELAAAAGAEGSFSPRPTRPLERKIAAIWAEHLGPDEISVLDSFPDLGGQSLLAVQIMSQIEADLGISIDILDLFTQNLSQFATQCEQDMVRLGIPLPAG